MKIKEQRVFFLNYHDAPYRTPVLSYLKNSGTFEEFFVADMFSIDSGHHYWNLKYNFTPDIVLEASARIRCGKRKWHPEVANLLQRDFDCIVVNGFYHLTSLFLLLRGFFGRTPVIFIADNVEIRCWGRLRRVLEHLKLKALNIFCSKYWVPGAATRKYLERFGGVDAHNVFYGAYTMDSSKLVSDFEHQKLFREANRKAIGLRAETRVFIMAANFIENRQHLNLVRTFAECSKSCPGIQLLLLGEGPFLDAVKSLVIDKHLEGIVIMPGGVAYDELAKYYSVADVYLHAGWEPYSTAVVIAASLGLPLAVSSEVGAVEDVLKHGVNGWSFDPRDEEELVKLIERFVGIEESDLIRMGEESATLASNYTPEWAGEEFIRMVESCV